MSKSDFSAGEIIHVATGTPYDVLIRRRLLYRCGAIVRDVLPGAERALIIADSNVAPLYADTVRRSLEAAEYAVSVHVFPAGEENKRLDEIGKMYEAMAEAGLTPSPRLWTESAWSIQVIEALSAETDPGLPDPGGNPFLAHHPSMDFGSFRVSVSFQSPMNPRADGACLCLRVSED